MAGGGGERLTSLLPQIDDPAVERPGGVQISVAFRPPTRVRHLARALAD